MKVLASLLFVAILFLIFRFLATGSGHSHAANGFSDDDDIQHEPEEDFLARERAFDHDD